MLKLVNFIALLLFSSLLAFTPVYATSHEAKEKEAVTATEEATAKAGDASASEADGKKKGDEEEEPDCD